MATKLSGRARRIIAISLWPALFLAVSAAILLRQGDPREKLKLMVGATLAIMVVSNVLLFMFFKRKSMPGGK